MARPPSDQPTELELQFLKMLWECSPQPVREIRDALARDGRDIAHTSVITTLNTMVGKKFLKRKKQGKSYLFSPRVTREQVSRTGGLRRLLRAAEGRVRPPKRQRSAPGPDIVAPNSPGGAPR